MDPRNDIPAAGQIGKQRPRDYCNEKMAADMCTEPSEPTLAFRLEQKRNRLTRELVEIEEALRLLYSDPNAEKIFATLKRARI